METFDPHKTTTEVRGANRRTMNLKVLIISLVVIVIAFGLIWGFNLMQPAGNVIS
jgi:hypothetical protein